MSAVDGIKFTHDEDQHNSDIKHCEVDITKHANCRTFFVVQQDGIDSSIKEEERIPSICDVVVLANSAGKIIVAADYINKKIKAFYRMKYKSYMKVQDINIFPWLISKITNDEIAMSGSSKIVFVKFNPDPVVAVTVNTNRQYCGLSALGPDQLLGGAGGIIDVLGRDGKVLKSLRHDVKIPTYIHLAKQSQLLVSDTGSKSVLSATIEGKINFTYSPRGGISLREPSGITTTANGDILSADARTGNVIQLTDTGQFVKNILTKQDGLNYPRGLYLDEDGLLCVASQQYVKVYKFV